MIILGASLPTFGGSESMTKPAGTTPPPDEGCTDVLIETLALVGGIEPVVRIGGQPSSCRPPTDRGCKGPFKEPPLTAGLGGPARAALLVMRDRIAEPEDAMGRAAEEMATSSLHFLDGVPRCPS
jgi:hypothetical protein